MRKSGTAQDRLRSDVTWGVRGGLSFALIYSCWVTIVYALHGSAPFAKNGVTFTSVVVTYVGVGIVAGALVGVLRPLTCERHGAYIVGFLAGLVLSAGLVMCVYGPPAIWGTREVFVLGFLDVGATYVLGNELWKAAGSRPDTLE